VKPLPALRRLALVVAVLGGCVTVAPTAPPIVVPDVRGLWTGTWGGTPLTLTVIDQSDDSGTASGVYAGPYLILGGRSPGLSGVMTYTARSEQVTVNVEGRFGTVAGTLALIVESAAPAGNQQLVLSQLASDHMIGTGKSKFDWGPQGPVELKRPPR